MAWRLFRLAPLFKHRGCHALQFLDLLPRLRVGDEFETMTIWIEKVDRLKDTVIGRSDDIEVSNRLIT